MLAKPRRHPCEIPLLVLTALVAAFFVVSALATAADAVAGGGMNVPPEASFVALVPIGLYFWRSSASRACGSRRRSSRRPDRTRSGRVFFRPRGSRPERQLRAPDHAQLPPYGQGPAPHAYGVPAIAAAALHPHPSSPHGN